MSGKLILLIVLGLIVSTFYLNQSVDKYSPVEALSKDFNKSMAYNIASTGASVAANKLFFDPTYTGTLYDNIDFESGKLNIDVTGTTATKVVTIKGYYPANNGPLNDDQQVTEISYTLSQQYIDVFAVLTDVDNSVPWTTFDVVGGDIHSNNSIWLDKYTGYDNGAIFKGHVTTGDELVYKRSDANPVFSYTPTTGVHVNIPTSFNLPSGLTANNLVPNVSSWPSWNMKYTFNNQGETITTNKQLHLQFSVESGVTKVKYFTEKRATSSDGNRPPTGNMDYTGSDWDNYGYYGTFKSTDTKVTAPEVIYVQGADVFVEGTIKGKVSVVCEPDASGKGGNVIVTNDVKCYNDPTTNPASTDYVGLLAKNNFLVGNTQSNVSNNGSPYTFTVQATVVALTGGVSAIDNRKRYRRNLNIFGSITQKNRKGVGDGSNSIGSSSGGFAKKYDYDTRLINETATAVPMTDMYGLYSYLVKSYNR